MHWHRIELNGSVQAVAAAGAALARAGAAIVIGRRVPRLVWCTAAGIEAIEAHSRRHPRVAFGVECFEEFGDDLVRAVVKGGETTIMSRGGVLPEGWGSYHDEDGASLEPALLAEAGETIRHAARGRRERELASGLEVALAASAELGRLATVAAKPRPEGAPARETLDAVVRFALLALDVGGAVRPANDVERAYEEALRLTQAVVHAGVSEFEERPGEADWAWWLGVLLFSGSGLVEAAVHCPGEEEPQEAWRAQASEHHGTPQEHLELEARSMLTTCVEVLTLFAPRGARD